MELSIILLLLLITWAAFIVYRFATVKSDAYDIFEARKEDADIASLGRENFVSIYRRTHNPLFHIYTLCGLVFVVLAFPVIYYVAASFWSFVWNISGRPEDLQEGFLPWLLYIAFMSLVGIAGIAALMTRLYYIKRPKTFEIELKNAIQSKGQ